MKRAALEIGFMSENKLPNIIDKHVGQRLRWRRRQLNLSQEKLGELLGLTFQQIQKYERGVNRVSAGRLFELAKVMEVKVPYFYEGLDDAGVDSFQKSLAETGRDYEPGETQPGSEQVEGAGELVELFSAIPDPKLREAVLTMVRSAAAPFVRSRD